MTYKPSLWLQPAASQSLAGYLRQHLGVIETRIANGVRQRQIVDELASLGYVTSLLSLRNALMRARRAAKPRVRVQGASAVVVGERHVVASGPYADAVLDPETKHHPPATAGASHGGAPGRPVVLPPAAVPPVAIPALHTQVGFRFTGTKDLTLEDLI